MKRIASVLALLGCIVHATLLPWHAAARMSASIAPAGVTALSDAAQLSQDLLVICHTDGSGMLDGQGLAPQPAPADQSPECQVCKGLAGFQLVVLVAAELGLLAPLPSVVVIAAATARLDEGVAIVPRSRGPPLSV